MLQNLKNCCITEIYATKIQVKCHIDIKCKIQIMGITKTQTIWYTSYLKIDLKALCPLLDTLRYAHDDYNRILKYWKYEKVFGNP